MATLNLTIQHGRPFDVARANFIQGVERAEARYGSYVRRVEWSDDRAAVRVYGSGFEVELKVDEEAVHARGHVPFFVRMMEGQVRRFVQEALGSP